MSIKHMDMQAKFQALFAVAIFMFKIEFWLKNVCP